MLELSIKKFRNNLQNIMKKGRKWLNMDENGSKMYIIQGKVYGGEIAMQGKCAVNVRNVMNNRQFNPSRDLLANRKSRLHAGSAIDPSVATGDGHNPGRIKNTAAIVRLMSEENQLTRSKRRLQLIYRLCQGQKARLFHDNVYIPGNVLELIDRFRTVLNTMLEDESGVYPSEEILNVSRELDDMIFYYYHNVQNTEDMVANRKEVE